MRVISGYLGSRKIEAPKGTTTHPMGERARGGLFNSLGDISGMHVLDAFSGSGALAFEAVSRGAASVVAVEKDAHALRAIKVNRAALDLEGSITVIHSKVEIWSEHAEDQNFDLILCDPPYDNLQIPIIEKLLKHLKNNGLMVISYSGRKSAPTVNGVVVVDESNYGNAALAYYRKTKT